MLNWLSMLLLLDVSPNELDPPKDGPPSIPAALLRLLRDKLEKSPPPGDAGRDSNGIRHDVLCDEDMEGSCMLNEPKSSERLPRREETPGIRLHSGEDEVGLDAVCNEGSEGIVESFDEEGKNIDDGLLEVELLRDSLRRIGEMGGGEGNPSGLPEHPEQLQRPSAQQYQVDFAKTLTCIGCSAKA